MLYYLKNLESVWGPFRLFEYQTTRAVAAGVLALVLAFVFAPKFIRIVAKHATPPRSEGDEVRSVPSFGGFIILIPALLSALLFARPTTPVFAALLVFAGMSLVGFWDDLRKIRTKTGISKMEKTVGLTVVSFAGVAVLLADSVMRPKTIEIWIPFLKTALLSADALPLWAGIAAAAIFFWIVTFSSSNAVNATDGLDGLAVGCSITTLLSFGIVSYLAGNAIFSKYLQISHVPRAGELMVITAAVLGGCFVFLWHNAKPAAIFMGDTGSLGLGGYIGAVAFICNQPFLLPIIGGVFVIEAASSEIQTRYINATRGQGPEGGSLRILKKAPLHHHFQIIYKAGAWLNYPPKSWSNEKIVVRFWLISLLCGIIGLATLKLR